jgi:hypothetical protein
VSSIGPFVSSSVARAAGCRANRGRGGEHLQAGKVRPIDHLGRKFEPDRPWPRRAERWPGARPDHEAEQLAATLAKWTKRIQKHKVAKFGAEALDKRGLAA